MKERIIMLCLTLSTFIWSQDHVSVNINLEKTSYLLSEPIFFDITCINSSNRPIPIYYITDYLIIQDKSGKVYHSNIETLGPIHTIAPGDTFSYTHEILSLYGHCWLKDENDYYGLPKGTYNIYVQYSGEKFIIESNKLIINIIEPEGDEKEALELYSKMHYMNTHRKKFSYQETMKVGLSLVEQYPNSVYTPSALILAMVREERKTGSLKYFEQLVNNYPNNRSAADALKHHINVFDNYSDPQKVEIKNIMQSVINRFPNSLVAKEAAKQLKKLGIK